MTTDSTSHLLQIAGANARPVTNSEVQMSLTFLMVVIAKATLGHSCTTLSSLHVKYLLMNLSVIFGNGSV